MIRYLLIFISLFAIPCFATNYYLSPSGSDSNNGTSTGTPWLSPNHAVNCGDIITAAASSSYSGWNFWQGEWGAVTGSGHCFATLKCTTFDACIISGSTGYFWVDKPHWMIAGWEVQGSSAPQQYIGCFMASPNQTTPSEVYDVAFVDDIANGCIGGGFSTFNDGTSYSVDYIAIVGDIVYNAAQGNTACYSGISVYQPLAKDTSPGTHIYIAGNFSYANYDPATCNGGGSTDGEGIIVDSLDYSQSSGTPYSQQVVVQNNITVGNGSSGLEVPYNSVGSSLGNVYMLYNTSWGNLRDTHQNRTDVGELFLYSAYNVQAWNNLLQTSTATGLGGNAIYAMAVGNGNATDHLYSTYASGVSGNNTIIYTSGSFAYGPNNTIGTAVSFSNPTVPGAPSCSSYASTVACMATLISNFTPTSVAAAYGYQTVSNTSRYDPLYPQWLCSTNLPTGLVTPGCVSASAFNSGDVYNSGTTIQ
jgi:hypothetical protein